MPAITGLQAITAALGRLNIYLPGETPNANDASFALGELNRLLSSWRQRSLLVSTVSRQSFALVANQGGIGNPYTIGTGGTFATTRPANQNSLLGVNLVLTASTPDSRVPLARLNDSEWASLATPDLTGSQPSAYYYDPTIAGGLGRLYLWPIPDNTTNQVELFINSSLAVFADLSTSYQVDDGVDAAIVANLTKLLAGPFGRTLSPEDREWAAETLSVVKRANSKPSYVANDYGRGGRYDIDSGTTIYRG